MRMYIVTGTVGSGIVEVVGQLWEDLFSRGFRSSRLVYGRSDRVDFNSTETADEFIATIEQDLLNRANTTDIIVTGSLAAKYHKEIRAKWPDESLIIFVKKSNKQRGIEAGLCLLESHTSYDRESYAEFISAQLDELDQSVEQLGSAWVGVDVSNMFSVDTEKLSESDSMVPDLIVCNEYTGPKSADCVIRQLAIY
jgi:hypothetical protein